MIIALYLLSFTCPLPILLRSHPLYVPFSVLSSGPPYVLGQMHHVSSGNALIFLVWRHSIKHSSEMTSTFFRGVRRIFGYLRHFRLLCRKRLVQTDVRPRRNEKHRRGQKNVSGSSDPDGRTEDLKPVSSDVSVWARQTRYIWIKNILAR